MSRWTGANYALARAERLNPPAASRFAAYAAIALYEGWAQISDSLRTLAGQLNGLNSLPKPTPGERYDPAVVAVAAQTAVLLDFYRTGFPSTAVAIKTLHDSLVAARGTAGIPRSVLDRSLRYGGDLGAAIVRWAGTDNFRETSGKTIVLKTGPQYWVPTATQAEYRSQNLSAQTDIVQLDNPAAGAGRDGTERSLTVNRPKPLGTALVPGVVVTQAVEWS